MYSSAEAASASILRFPLVAFEVEEDELLAPTDALLDSMTRVRLE